MTSPHPGFVCDETCEHGGLRRLAPLKRCANCNGEVERGSTFNRVTCFFCGYEGPAESEPWPDAKKYGKGLTT